MFDARASDFCLKSPCSTPVHRILLQKKYFSLKRLSSRPLWAPKHPQRVPRDPQETLKIPQRGSKRVPRGSKRVPREPKRVRNRPQNDTKMLPELIIMIFDMPKSACSMPVQRILVQNQHVRCLCSGFWSQKAYFHEKVILCDACRAD